MVNRTYDEENVHITTQENMIEAELQENRSACRHRAASLNMIYVGLRSALREAAFARLVRTSLFREKSICNNLYRNSLRQCFPRTTGSTIGEWHTTLPRKTLLSLKVLGCSGDKNSLANNYAYCTHLPTRTSLRKRFLGRRLSSTAWQSIAESAMDYQAN